MKQHTITAASAPYRLYALDNLRALMMWLGIVLHVAAIYLVVPLPSIPWHDPQTTPMADLLLGFIHTFRMPMFFILAGFFVALMVQKKGAGGMLKNRLRRLGLPFVVFWLPVFVAMVVLMLLFLHQMARGTWGLDLSLIAARAGEVDAERVRDDRGLLDQLSDVCAFYENRNVAKWTPSQGTLPHA